MVDICNWVNGATSNKVEMFLIALCVFKKKKKTYLKYVTRVPLKSVTHVNWHSDTGSNFKVGQILLQTMLMSSSWCKETEKSIVWPTSDIRFSSYRRKGQGSMTFDNFGYVGVKH